MNGGEVFAIATTAGTWLIALFSWMDVNEGGMVARETWLVNSVLLTLIAGCLLAINILHFTFGWR